ncbi:DegT/DnrJ/EryC1/StrS family aminotransferase [Gemmatimonas sp.]|uniref:DegT/DnrJ/EryC1/StrS family aminotransferase n=1 Tax=Gemmatimonas sp. TaxID=1962908 RepID=UPI0022C67D5B|nr:DegT/DnrJ/EryC1/StrS family aminotransferase [Gemmatimonas sp.]MCZ8204100.1 DegT/DnrJ/EryC1/StrS family aminotransferase [Gemmatimonas sp.]
MTRHLPPVHFPLPLTALLASLGAAWRDRQQLDADARAVLEARFPDRSITLTDSGTSALAMAISASAAPGRAHQPVVALPAYGCPDLGTAAIAANAHILLYDVEPDTLQPDFASLTEALAGGASHVVVIHAYGRTANLDTARALAAETGAIVIEDAAQGADACWNGVCAGNLADWSILSLGRGKGYNAGGGGILLGPTPPVDDPLPVDARAPGRLGELRHAVTTVITQLLSHPTLYGIPAGIPALGLGETRYHAPAPPTPISRSALALLATAIQQSARAAEARRRHERQYLDALEGCREVSLPAPHPSSLSGALRVPVLVDPGRAAQLHRLGVVRSYPRPLDAYQQIAARILGRRDMPGARQLAAFTHTLPTHRHVREQDLRHIVRVLSKQP